MEKSRIVASSRVSLIEFDVESELLIGAALQNLAEKLDTTKSQRLATDGQLQEVVVKNEPGNDSSNFEYSFNEDSWNCDDAPAHILQQPQLLNMSSGGSATFSTLTDMTQEKLQVKQIQYRPNAVPGNIENTSNINLLEVLQNDDEYSETDDANESLEIIDCDSDTDYDVDNNIVEESIEVIESEQSVGHVDGEKYIVYEYSDDEATVCNDTYDTDELNETNTKFESDDYANSITYICPKCGQICANKTDWFQHTNDVHQMNEFKTLNMKVVNRKNGKKTYVCKICKKTVVESYIFEKWKIHYIGHLPFKKYLICKICNKSYQRSGDMKRHFVNSHQGKSKKKCVKKNPITNSDEAMKQIDESVNDAFDDADDHAYDDADDNAFHDTDDNANDDANDDTDEAHTTKLSTFEQTIIYLCPKCGKSCGNKTSWLQHTNDVHQFDEFKTLHMNFFQNEQGHNSYECTICYKTIYSGNMCGSVKEHFISHLPFKKYHKCRICKRTYQRIGDFRRHLKQGHEPKPRRLPADYNSDPAMQYLLIICQVCAEPQIDRKGLYEHLQHAHDFRNESKKYAKSSDGTMYTCRLCNIAVKKLSFERHMLLLHEQYKPFVCTFCNLYSTTTMELFVKHVNREHMK